MTQQEQYQLRKKPRNNNYHTYWRKMLFDNPAPCTLFI